MIATQHTYTIPTLTSEALDRFMDEIYDAESDTPAVLDTSVSATIGTGLLEVELTVEALNALAAIDVANDFIHPLVVAHLGHRQLPAKVTADLIA